MNINFQSKVVWAIGALLISIFVFYFFHYAPTKELKESCKNNLVVYQPAIQANPSNAFSEGESEHFAVFGRKFKTKTEAVDYCIYVRKD